MMESSDTIQTFSKQGMVGRRSGKQLWSFARLIVSKLGRLFHLLKCNDISFWDAEQPLQILAKMQRFGFRSSKICNEERNTINAGSTTSLEGDEVQLQSPLVWQGKRAVQRAESTVGVLESMERKKRLRPRKVIIRLDRNRMLKREASEYENEFKRLKFSRKRRRLSKGASMARQQIHPSDTNKAIVSSAPIHARKHSLSQHTKDKYSLVACIQESTTSSITQCQASPRELVLVLQKRSEVKKKLDSTLTDQQFLPNELVEKLLAWVPITSAFRFRAVCRRWHYILSGKGWNKLFNKPPAWEACICFFSCGKGRRECAFFDNGAQRWSIVDMDFLPRPACRLLAASGGLLCICSGGEGKRVYICNPLTKSWRELPELHHKQRRAGAKLVHLLVNSATSSYKVIVIGHPVALSPRSATTSTLTEIYDSETGVWSALAAIPSTGCILAQSMVFRNGILYCLTEHPTGLLAFNVARKVWRRLEIKSHSRVLCVLEHNGHILIVARLGARIARLGIWKLRESFPRVWMKVALMPVEHSVYFFLSGNFQCAAHGDHICFASPCRPRWLLFNVVRKQWVWGMPAHHLDHEKRNSWFFYEPRLDMLT